MPTWRSASDRSGGSRSAAAPLDLLRLIARLIPRRCHLMRCAFGVGVDVISQGSAVPAPIASGDALARARVGTLGSREAGDDTPRHTCAAAPASVSPGGSQRHHWALDQWRAGSDRHAFGASSSAETAHDDDATSALERVGPAPEATGGPARLATGTPRNGREMSAGATVPSFWQQQLVDEAVLAYAQWREESATVWAAYSRWTSASAEDAGRAHAAYRAALDREEAAAKVYASSIGRVSELLRTGSD
jgi:hypothetical protein